MNTSNSQTGHPKGLYLLFVTEMWERFSYYGMRAIFMLYMVNALFLSNEQASQIYGSYTGLVYLTPLLGGYISDKYWGNRKSILYGGLMMALGQFLMFISATYHDNYQLAFPVMIAGLFALVLGNGFFKPNISTMVGDLYPATDKRKDAAFTIFYMGINLGAFISPLICGSFTAAADEYRWGFLVAAIGMVIGIIVFEVLKNKYLCTPEGLQIGLNPKKDAVHHDEHVQAQQPASLARKLMMVIGTIVLFFLFSVNYGNDGGIFAGADWIGSFIFSIGIMIPVFIITDPSLNKDERSRIWVIYIVSFFVIFFFAAFEQAGMALTVFADKQVDRNLFGWEMSAAYFQSFNPVFVITLAPIFALVWTALGKRNAEPSSPLKQSIGLFLLAIGYLIIAFGVKGIGAEAKISMIWLILMYLLHTMGELSLSPIGLSLVNKLAPARLASLLMGVWLLSSAAANKFAGMLSGCYPYETNAATGESVLTPKDFMGYGVENLYDFFMIFVVMSAVAAVVLFFLSSKLQKMMRGIN